MAVEVSVATSAVATGGGASRLHRASAPVRVASGRLFRLPGGLNEGVSLRFSFSTDAYRTGGKSVFFGEKLGPAGRQWEWRLGDIDRERYPSWDQREFDLIPGAYF